MTCENRAHQVAPRSCPRGRVDGPLAATDQCQPQSRDNSRDGGSRGDLHGRILFCSMFSAGRTAGVSRTPVPP